MRRWSRQRLYSELTRSGCGLLAGILNSYIPIPRTISKAWCFRSPTVNDTSTWVNTVFDLAEGHIQYAYVLANAMVTLHRHSAYAHWRCKDACGRSV